MTESLRGRLLVAAPTLYEPNFFRTVVLVLEHSDDGALGVVLNRPSETDVSEPLPAWAPVVVPPAVVFAGGPVQPSAAIGLARAADGQEAQGWAPLFDRFGTVDLERSPNDLAARVDRLRVFAGYAGWGAGQLDGEVQADGWFVIEADPDDAFSREPGALWRRVLKRQKGKLAMFANAPPHPALN
jgi:putative transcriptional regulator